MDDFDIEGLVEEVERDVALGHFAECLAAVDAAIAERTRTVVGAVNTAAGRHFFETGHVLEFGCCRAE